MDLFMRHTMTNYVKYYVKQALLKIIFGYFHSSIRSNIDNQLQFKYLQR